MPLNAAAIKRTEKAQGSRIQMRKQKAIKSMPKGSRKHTHTHTLEAMPFQVLETCSLKT